MRQDWRRYYLLLAGVLFVMFCCTPIGCSCKKDKDDDIGVGALTVSPGPQNGSTGGTVTGGDTDVVMLQFTVSSGAAIVTISSVTIHATGTGNDALHVANVRLYRDGDSDGQLDTAPTDVLLAGPTSYSQDNGTITFTYSQTLNANTSETWMIVYDFLAGADGTFICYLDNVGSDFVTTVGGKLNIPIPGGGSTGSITGGTATAQPNTLTVAEGADNPLDSSVTGDTNNVAMLQFSLTAGPGQTVTWTGVTFSGSGTGHEVNDIKTDGVNLWEDTGTPDGVPDTLIDVGQNYVADNGTVGWTGLSETLAASVTRTFILTYDFEAGVDGTFHVEIVNVATDVTAQAGGQPITPVGTNPISGPTITVDSTPPQVVRAMFDGVDPTSPAAGDTIKVYFDEEITVGSPTGASFALPVTSDSLGTPTVEAAPNSVTAVLITLGGAITLTIPGTYDPAITGAGSPSGIDVAASITAGDISDLAGNAPAQLSPDVGVDIKGKFVPDGLAVTDLEMNVLTPQGDQAGDLNGNVMIQYLVAAPDAMDVSLSVEFDDGSGGGFQAATEGSPAIFTDHANFDPSDTGDLRIYVWNAVSDFSTAGASSDSDIVVLRFTFDPGTPGDASDDVIDEISFNLDNKPQAVCTRPYVTPARKWAFVDASDSWNPGSSPTIPIHQNSYAWTFDSWPAGSAILDADIIETTLGNGSVMWAYFMPDVAGDYVMSLVVNTGLVNSDAVTTTIHVLGPDSYAGSAVTELDVDGAGTMYNIYPTNIGLDEAGEAIFYTSGRGIATIADFITRYSTGKMDVSTLPGTIPADGDFVWWLSYAAQYGWNPDLSNHWDICRPQHIDTFYNGATYSLSCTNMILGTDYVIYYQGNAFLDSVAFGTSPDFFIELAQADLDPVTDLPEPAAVRAQAGRVCQAVRGVQTVDYWIVHAVTSTFSSWLVETQGDPDDPFTPTFTAVMIPNTEEGYDVEVQLGTFGINNETAWLSAYNLTNVTGHVYYSDLSVGVGTVGALTALADYPGTLPYDMVIDDTNGYLFVTDYGDPATANGSIYAVSLESRTVVATLNLPGDWSLDEVDIDVSAGSAMIFGVNSYRGEIQMIQVDYPVAADPVMTLLPSIDAATDPYDVVYDGTRDVIFVSERAENVITSMADSATSLVIDYGLVAGGTAEQNAEWAVDPVTGDLCMVFQRDANNGIFFTRSADGGLNWSAPVAVYSGAGANIGNPDIAVDPWGTIVVVWADDSNTTDLDVFVSRSIDDGATWDGPFKVNTDSANDQGNPCVAVDFLGNIIVAFESDDGSGNVAIELVKGVGNQRWTYFGPVDSNIAVTTTPVTWTCLDPDMALSPLNGYTPDIWVTWSDTRSATAEDIMVAYTRTYYGTTTPLSGMLLDFSGAEAGICDSDAGDALHARAVYDPFEGEVIVVWEQDLGNGAGIYLDKGYKAGFGTDMVVEEPADATSGTRNNPYLSVDLFGGIWFVAYESDLKGDKDVFWEVAQFDASGNFGFDGEGIRMNADDTNAQVRPLIQAFPGPVTIVTWEDARTGNKDLYSKRQ